MYGPFLMMFADLKVVIWSRGAPLCALYKVHIYTTLYKSLTWKHLGYCSVCIVI